MNLKHIMLSERSQAKIDGILHNSIYCIEISRIGKSIEPEVRIMVEGGE